MLWDMAFIQTRHLFTFSTSLYPVFIQGNTVLHTIIRQEEELRALSESSVSTRSTMFPFAYVCTAISRKDYSETLLHNTNQLVLEADKVIQSTFRELHVISRMIA